jgi:hypothetical protein
MGFYCYFVVEDGWLELLPIVNDKCEQLCILTKSKSRSAVCDPANLKLDEEQSKHASLAQQK